MDLRFSDSGNATGSSPPCCRRSLLQISLGPGPVHPQVLGSLFATAVCATVAFRQRYPATAGMTAQGLMALDFDTWHNLAAGGWTIAWFCSLYGLAVWSRAGTS